MANCIKCKTELAEGSTFCSSCGAAQSPAVINDQNDQSQNSIPNYAQPTIIINNTNANTNTVAVPGLRLRNKWIALILCFFFGFLGVHKFYEGKVGMGILYIFTGGLLGIGVIVDFITILFKPTQYYV